MKIKNKKAKEEIEENKKGNGSENQNGRGKMDEKEENNASTR